MRGLVGDGTPALKWGSTNAYTEDSHGNAVYDWSIVDGIFDAYLKKHDYAVDTVMTDEQGHQLPVFQYPGLSRRDIMDAVERFYGRYYFRPHVIFRILRRAVFDRNDRSRLYVEAKAFLKVRAKRKEFAGTPVGT